MKKICAGVLLLMTFSGWLFTIEDNQGSQPGDNITAMTRKTHRTNRQGGKYHRKALEPNNHVRVQASPPGRVLNVKAAFLAHSVHQWVLPEKQPSNISTLKEYPHLNREFDFHHRDKRSTNHIENLTRRHASHKLGDDTLDDLLKKYDTCYNESRIDTCKTSQYCSCEDNCLILENCCLDAPHRTNETLPSFLALFKGRVECVDLGITRYKLVTSCLPNPVASDLENACSQINETSVLHMTPVYDNWLKLSYRNVFCARCNGANVKNLQFWEIILHRCALFGHHQGNGLTRYIDVLLNKHETACRLHVVPKKEFSSERCYKGYIDEYQCDEYDQMDDANWEGSSMTRTTEMVSSSTTNRSTNVLSTTQPPHSGVEYAMSTSDLREICYSYKHLILMGMHLYRNGICVWCKRMEKICFTTIETPIKDLSFSVLINFHSAFDVISHDERKVCEENEVIDTLNNVCKRLTCIGHQVASYGNCIDMFSSLTSWVFRFTVFAHCRSIPNHDKIRITMTMLAKLVRFPMQSALYSERWTNMSNVFSQSTGEEYCYKTCTTLFIRSKLSRADVFEVIDILNDVFAFSVNGSRKELVRLDLKNNFTDCLVPIQKERMSSMTCPYIALNKTEFTMLEKKIENKGVALNSAKFVKIDQRFLVCFGEYKKMVKLLEAENLEKNNKTKSLLSVILVCLSLLALTISSLIYVIHPELKTVPCRISLNCMLILALTCLLFILSYMFDTNVTICYVLGIFTHYSWLCVLLWSMLFGYHSVIVFSTLPVQRKPNLNVRKRPNSSRLFVYGIIAFVTPIFVVCSTAVLDFTDTIDVDYGIPTCFINNKKSLLYAFGVPVMAMCLLNATCLIISTIMLYRFAPGGSSCAQIKSSVLKTAVKLFLCSGLTWIFGILAAINNAEMFWYLHIIFNSSHGIFLFLVLVAFSKQVRTWCRCKRTCISGN